MTLLSAGATQPAPTRVTPMPLVCSIPNLPPPSNPPPCSEEWRRFAASNNDAVIFGLAWQNHHLVAVTSSGQVCIWNVPTVEDEEEMDEVESLQVFQKQRLPIVKVQVSTGVLYSIHFTTTSQQRTLMIISGDDGVLGYDWQQWLSLLEGGRTTPPEAVLHCKSHRSLSTVEINDFSVKNNHIFGAAGDANGYKWDMTTQQILATYPSAKRGYLHSIQCMPHDNTILSGGEDGILEIWDGHHDKLIDNINLQTTLQKDSSLVEIDKNLDNGTLDQSNLWISHIHSRSEHWWTVCGGIEDTASHNSTTAAGGHLTSWHAPTRSLVAGCLTRETPQCSCSTTGTLVTVANEGVVSHWTPSRFQRTGRVWCSPPSCFAAAIGNKSDNGELLAVGGVGNHVDVFDNVVDNKIYSLVLQ